MKILFNGCSITWGDELEDNRKSRFSKLVCDELDIDEKNLSMRGASNDYILRTTIDYCDKNTVDIAVIQFTVESRIEYFGDDAFPHQFAPANRVKCQNKNNWFYKLIYNEHHGYENLNKNLYFLDLYCKYKNIRLIPLWLDWSKKHQSFYWKSTVNLIHLCKDIWNNPEYNQGLIKSHEEILYPNYHPNELGHRWVADKIISLINLDK